MRRFVIHLQFLYQHRQITLENLQTMLSAGKITQEEYDWIVGE